MIAMLVGDESLRSGPIALALAHAGFETRTAQGVEDVERLGAGDCVLVVDAEALASQPGASRWAGFLARPAAPPAVLVAHGAPSPAVRAAALGPQRILVEDPFDAAAVVAAILRATRQQRTAPQPRRLQEAG
jgi:DNA-binding NtrC family response regulator